MSRAVPGLRPILLSLAVLLAGVLPSVAQDDGYPKGQEGGHKLAADLCALKPVQDTNWQGVLKISGRAHKTVSVPLTCEWQVGPASWQVTYTTSATNSLPAEKLTVAFSTNGPPQYRYASSPALGAPLGEARRLPGSEADIPLAGSDFWLSDLGFEFYHWPGQNLLKGELRRGRSCFVLECTNPDATAGHYGRVKVWVDKDSLAPLEAEAYGKDGNLLKDFELGSVTKVNGQYELKDLKITNDRSNSRTQLLFDLKTGDPAQPAGVQNPR
jgi:hypothetical protein